MISMEDALKFWSRVDVQSPDDCWEWQGAASAKGYGRIKLDGKLYSPHRIAYELCNGQLKNFKDINRLQHHGAVVMHTCDNPRCCNPGHLRAGTQRDNVKDMHRKNRNPECAWKTPADIEAKIRDCPLSSRKTAELFGVSKNTVLRIRKGDRHPASVS